MMRASFYQVVLILLCLVCLGCGGNPAERPPKATTGALAQPPGLNPSLDERIEVRVRLLSNRAIEYQGGVTWTGCILKSETANQLVWIGKPATSQLLRALREPDKNLAAHVVLTAIWEPDKVSTARGWNAEFISFRPLIAQEDLRVAEQRWKQKIAVSPTTEQDYQDAEARWAREIAKAVPLLSRYQQTQ